jgi:formylglycine-generating enzyme required for sulfatase activity
VRLTVLRFEAGGEPDPAATVDAYVALPSVADGTIADVTVQLSTDDTGAPASSLDQPDTPRPGPPGASAVGSWAAAQRATCSTSQPAGAVCVPGGAYWMGGGSSNHLVPGADPSWRRLVALSPFWLDSTEVTVAATRAGGGLRGVGAWSGSTQGTDSTDFCTWSPTPTIRDPLPANCVAPVGAKDYCTRHGAALPSEAQLECVSGGASGQPYPWGFDFPGCGDAIWGRDGYGAYALELPQTCLSSSNFLAPLGGPEPPRSGAIDVAHLPGGNVYDLAGNLYEIARDSFEYDDQPCWASPGVMRDPVCLDQGTQSTVRGGAWTVGGTYLEAGHRAEIGTKENTPELGFRCAWPGQ